MKGPTRLAAPLAAYVYLAQAAIVQDDLDFLYACESLTIDPENGVLSGECQVGENPAVTSVDLNKCLGWGSPNEYVGEAYGITHGGPHNALAPVENGNFTRNCHPCYLIDKGESGQTVAQLMCSCSPEGSEFKTEYSLDLTNTVSVTEYGCLECMGASGDCAPEVPLNRFKKFDPGDLDTDGFNDVEELLDWLKLRAEADLIPCEYHIRWNPQLLPKTYPNTTHHRCKAAHSLCCYQTTGIAYDDNCLTNFDAFLLIEGNTYWYRMHYTVDIFTPKIEYLSKVIQLCGSPGSCDAESMPDDTSAMMNCTYNPLERWEDRVYDNGTDVDSPSTTILVTVTATLSDGG